MDHYSGAVLAEVRHRCRLARYDGTIIGTKLLEVKFWGVRGSYPTPCAANLGYGGNTCCVTVRYNREAPLIFDAGSGVRALGSALLPEIAQTPKLTLFFSHFHWDHVQGVPQFAPLFRKEVELVLYSVIEPERLDRILGAQMAEPFYPVDWNQVPARRTPARAAPDGIAAGSSTVRPFPLYHPGGCSGYRIETPAGTVVFATDHEHGDPRADSILREYAAGADVLIYDAQYTPEEYPRYRGWGHGTWLEGVRLARAANVQRLVLFHHDPARDDDQVRSIAADAAAAFPGACAAKENWSIRF